MKWFYAGMGLGFVVGFWGFCGAFLLKSSWRHSYFRFLDKVWLELQLKLVPHGCEEQKGLLN
ncbi:hypothetical protein QQP08_020760 [Theobroma cacao]|nr:hypothetical protein QQP08_020760 [Theobroma cacao]